MLNISIGDIRNLSHPLGVEPVWFSGLQLPAEATRRLKVWRERGFDADLAYMKRPPELFTDPTHLLNSAKSILLFAFHYTAERSQPLPHGFGRVARYAWGQDYHRVLKKQLERLMAEIAGHLSRTFQFRIFSDAVPLLERAYAESAGIGFIGRNSMLIRPRQGSYFLLAEVITELVVEGDAPIPSRSSCGSCTRCVNKCPTQAIVDDFVVDAGKCISYLTIEKRDSLSHHERTMLGEWIFGCDVCQEVCPFNHRAQAGKAEASVLKEFDPASGVGPFLNLKSILSIRDDGTFTKRFAGTPLMRSKRTGLLRNAAAVAVNTNDESSVPALREAFDQDPEDVIRQHALWAVCLLSRACNMGNNKTIEELVNKARRDSSERVRAEAQWLAENIL